MVLGGLEEQLTVTFCADDSCPSAQPTTRLPLCLELLLWQWLPRHSCSSYRLGTLSLPSCGNSSPLLPVFGGFSLLLFPHPCKGPFQQYSAVIWGVLFPAGPSLTHHLYGKGSNQSNDLSQWSRLGCLTSSSARALGMQISGPHTGLTESETLGRGPL